MVAVIRLFLLSILASVSMQTLYKSDNQSLRDHSNIERSIDCSPAKSNASGKNKKFSHVQILPGWGHHHYAITTESDGAQLYFDQGLNMYYSYQQAEALASFQESARLDPHCAMAYWGEALAMGPGYNCIGFAMQPDLDAALNKLGSHDLRASSEELDLIQTLIVRYSAFKEGNQRHHMDDRYAEALKKLTIKYPGDIELKVLYVDAVMLEHAWDFWDKNGFPKDWTPELLELCQQILIKDSIHPGAMHYQIHICEASRHPEIALRSADLLKEAMPGVAHMVHMSSHTYERNALYEQAIDANEQAIINSDKYQELGWGFGGGDLHYRAVETVAAMNAGMYTKAMELASASKNVLLPTFVSIRLGKWNEILKTNADASSTYTTIMFDFARGLASVRTHDIRSARSSLDQISSLSTETELLKPDLPLKDSPIKAVNVARKILEAEIMAAENNITGAIASFSEAVRFEDEMVFFQPKNWLIPARQFFGAFLLKCGKLDQARACYEEDLKRNPGNGWSMIGMYQSLSKQGDFVNAEACQTKFKKIFLHADRMPGASVY